MLRASAFLLSQGGTHEVGGFPVMAKTGIKPSSMRDPRNVYHR